MRRSPTIRCIRGSESVTQPGNINMPIAILIVAILVAYVGMVYGPIGAFLAEFFPGRIRYTSVSMPYMIGNGWGGGLVPFITTAAYTRRVVSPMH